MKAHIIFSTIAMMLFSHVAFGQETEENIYPTEIATEFANQPRAAMSTCSQKYRENKEAGVEQPRWIVKGGGYWSECSKALKN